MGSCRSPDEIKEEYPLHWHVWFHHVEQLQEALISKLYDKEKTDPHGRTALHLSVSLGFVQCAKVLLENGCDPNATNKEGWNVVQEAVSTGDPELISLTIQYREYNRLAHRTGGVGQILESLEEAKANRCGGISSHKQVVFDFRFKQFFKKGLFVVGSILNYVSHSVEGFTEKLCRVIDRQNTVPFVSRMCPHDTYRIWKSGANVRVDTTLLGFEQMNWQRGNQSFIFKGGHRTSNLLQVDHEKHTFWKESVATRQDGVSLESMKPPPDIISSRLTSPNITSNLDTDRIAFNRQKSGFLGWAGDKVEVINGYSSKVYSVTGVEIITRTRTEHMTEEDRERFKAEKQQAQAQLPTFLQFFDNAEDAPSTSTPVPDTAEGCSNPLALTIEDYFDSKANPGKDIGRIKRMTSKTQKFSATLALCDTFPLSLQDQVLPVINLMANSNSHFAKLRDFITLQLPAGFPIKIEIPLFHVLNAKITFGNLNGTETCPDGVVTLEFSEPSNSEDSGEEVSVHKRVKCLIDKSIFELPAHYREIGMNSVDWQAGYRDEEDELLQLAIQQSLVDQPIGSQENVTLLEALGHRSQDAEEQLLQRAISESLRENDEASPIENAVSGTETAIENVVVSDDLTLALELSRRDLQQEERLRAQEEEDLERILKLSMVEK